MRRRRRCCDTLLEPLGLVAIIGVSYFLASSGPKLPELFLHRNSPTQRPHHFRSRTSRVWRPCTSGTRRAEDVVLKRSDEFWSTPLGDLRKQFLRLSSLPFLPSPGQLAEWVELTQIVPHQVKRDIEQFEYLLSAGVLNGELHQYVNDMVLPEYRSVLEAVTSFLAGHDDAYVMTHPREELAVFFSLQGKALHLHPGRAVPGEVLGSSLDLKAAQDRYMQSTHRVVVIDDFLTPEAWQQLRHFLLESSFWAEAKFGHVGVYLDTGFSCPLVAQIDQEIRAKLPLVMQDLQLENAWAYMYDGSLGGVGVHADDAQVQINLFLTPNDANSWHEDHEQPSGGLVVYGIGPPHDWEPEKYNVLKESWEIQELLASVRNWNVTIPFVENRAILFDSTYFHRSDSMNFKKGYKNRRINVTFLYGAREKLVPAAAFIGSSGSSESPDHTRAARTHESTQVLAKKKRHFYRLGERWMSEADWNEVKGPA